MPIEVVRRTPGENILGRTADGLLICWLLACHFQDVPFNFVRDQLELAPEGHRPDLGATFVTKAGWAWINAGPFRRGPDFPPIPIRLVHHDCQTRSHLPPRSS